MIEQSGCHMTGPRDQISRDAADANRSVPCLKGLTLHGRIFQSGLVMVNLISSVGFSKMRSVVARTCPSCVIVEAQMSFLTRKRSGMFVPVPHPMTS